MTFLSKTLFSAAAAIALVGAAQSASATTITWNPGATIPGLLSTSGPVTFDNITVNDYANITLTPTSATTFSATEHAYLQAAAFTIGSGGTIVSDPQFNTNGGFGLYFDVSATASLTTLAPGVIVGSFTSVTYTLYGYSATAGLASFTFATNTSNPSVTVPAGDTTLALATGSLLSTGTNSASVISGIPNASVPVSLVPNTTTAASGFFVNPTSAVTLDLSTAFINTDSVISSTSSGGITIFQIGNTGNGGGGGNVTAVIAPVPEPASLTILGSGLALFGLMRRNRKQS